MDPETKLTNDNLKLHLNEHDELQYCIHWKDVGHELGLKQGEINVIAEDYKEQGNLRCSYEMFKRWIHKSENPTLERLLQAITAISSKKILEEGKQQKSQSNDLRVCSVIGKKEIKNFS